MSTLEERFWPKVDRSDGCWEWNASISTAGYGQISVEGKPRYAHRISWELHFGPIADDLCVLHSCDNRKCVRPDHLSLGTREDNNWDTHSKGRWNYVRPGRGASRRKASGRPHGPMPTPPEERFWPKVDIKTGEVDTCWEFMGRRDPNGYGLFFVGNNGRTGAKSYAHRVAYALHYGAFDRSLVVMHTCDNPPCCNPSHLRLGTRADNNRDRSNKGRGRENRQWGKDNPRAQLTTAQVAEMRRLASEGVTQVRLAEMFSIKQPQISRIVRGLSWPEHPSMGDRS